MSPASRYSEAMPIDTEFFRWYILDEVTGKRRLTTYKMDRKTALERFPDAEPYEPSREVRGVLLPGEQPRGHRD